MKAEGHYSGRGRAGLKSALDRLTKPLEAAGIPPGSRFSDFVARASDGFSPSRPGLNSSAEERPSVFPSIRESIRESSVPA